MHEARCRSTRISCASFVRDLGHVPSDLSQKFYRVCKVYVAWDSYVACCGKRYENRRKQKESRAQIEAIETRSLHGRRFWASTNCSIFYLRVVVSALAAPRMGAPPLAGAGVGKHFHFSLFISLLGVVRFMESFSATPTSFRVVL